MDKLFKKFSGWHFNKAVNNTVLKQGSIYLTK